jgi:hypothetical protein
MPRQKLLDAVDGMIGDAGEHLAQISFRIQAVELGRTSAHEAMQLRLSKAHAAAN